MKIRHLSPAALVVAVLTACTPTVSTPEIDRAAAALEYVELLRGANDLAHGSLDVPSPSTLPAYAAVTSALRHADLPVPEASRDALVDLTRRSGEDAAWATFYLCAATGGDIPRVTDVVDDKNFGAGGIDSVNAAADRIIAESARACVGAPALLRDDDWSALAQWSSGNALVAVQLAALARRLGHPVPTGLLTSADLTSIAAAVEADGCSDWAHANSVATRSLATAPAAVPTAVPAAIEACAANDAVVLTDPTVLFYLVAADVAPAHLARLLGANEGVVQRALEVEGSRATPGAAPTGLGTIASSRDAVLYLRLSGATRVPDWLPSGVLDAVSGELAPRDSIDALFLCAALELDCPTAFLTRARTLTRDVIDASLSESSDAPARVNGAARAVETAREARLDVPSACTRDRVTAWLADDPQLLAAFAVGEKECVELVALDDATLTPLLRDALDNLRPEDALAYCLVRLLAGSARPDDSDFSTAAHAGFDALWSQIDSENGDDFLAAARPLRIELAHAKESQWLD